MKSDDVVGENWLFLYDINVLQSYFGLFDILLKGIHAKSC